MRATIADVAARSGVSTATVSRVLAGVGGARAETRERVIAAVRQLDYRPSAVARALKRRETRTLGLLIADIANPFYPQIVRSVEEAAHARGYGIILCNAADDPSRELACLDLLVERRVDGIIVASSRATRRHAARLARTAIPVVLVNSGAAASGLPSIDAAHRRGARMVTEHVLAHRHRLIGHVTAPRTNAAARLRLAGVRDALHAAGIGADQLRVVEGDGHVEGGARAAERLLADDRITAIVCYNDLTAIGALRAARRLGRRVPDDISVAGFDDIEAAAWTDPPLTSVRQPTDQMGRWAVDWLTTALSDASMQRAGKRDASAVHLEPDLVVRDSTGPAPR